MLRLALLACLAVLAVACGDDPPRFQDAGPTDAAIDAPVDATVDAGPPAHGQELTSGGGRMSGRRFVVDVQVGHGASQAPAAGARHTGEGNAPVKP